jgi:hypothetical protein
MHRMCSFQMAEAKRTTLLEQMSKDRKNRNQARMTRTQDRCVDTDTDTRKLSYSDAIRHLQVILISVQKYNNICENYY